jgi:alginate O-acetyltransferase complex protein AlgI
MSFAGAAFLFLFLPLVLVGWYALPRPARVPFLLLASWVFFAWWRVDFLALLVGASVATWLLGRGVAAARAAAPAGPLPRALLAAGIVLNIGCLAFFKYAGFGVDTLNALLAAAGARHVASGLRIALPVGISFFTFKAVSYLVDVYRGSSRPAASFLEAATYIAFLPQLTAGPIERFEPFAGGLASPARSFDWFSEGAARFLLGFAKKILVADTVASLADAAFGLARPTFVDAWVGALAYTIQLYFDFSGYSDMAIGVSRMLGMRTIENFQAPYLSASIGEFWKRWHISLSSWLRDYLYFPLGGNRRGLLRTCVNLMLVMLIGGLWHGSSWTFVLWGGWHGTLLVVERLLGTRKGRGPIPRPLGTVLTSFAVILGWVVFRAPTLATAGGMYAGMLGLHGFGVSPDFHWQVSQLSLWVLAGAVALTWLGPGVAARLASAGLAARWSLRNARLVLLPLFLLAILKIMAESYAPVLYARF